MATELATRVLHSLNDLSALPLASSEAFPDVEPTVLKGALDSLRSREMLVYETIDREEPVLTEEAEEIVRDGSHEAKVYEAVCAAMDGIKISELPRIVGGTTAKVGQGKAFKEGWIMKDGDRLLKKAASIQDTTRDQLELIKAKQTMPEPALLVELKKRKLITMQKRISFKIDKGPKFALEVVKEETDLTVEMIARHVFFLLPLPIRAMFKLLTWSPQWRLEGQNLQAL